jgi:hypothetical protein
MLISKSPFLAIVSTGLGKTLELKWRIEKWLKTSWFAQSGLRLTFWGEKWLGQLGGLVLKKPLFYDNYETGVLYREFTSLNDIHQSEEMFSQVRSVDDLISLMRIKLHPPTSYGFLTYKSLLLTRWTCHWLGLKTKTLKPIAMETFIPFFENLLAGPVDSKQQPSRRIPDQMKTSFLNWLAEDTGLRVYEITEKLGDTFEDLFKEIEIELGEVKAEDLDPRFVQLFLLKRDSKSSTRTH